MIKRTLIYSLLLVILFILGCSNQNAVNSENLELKEANKNINISSINYDNFKELNLEKDNIILKINGKTFNFNLPIYIDKNRYYLPLNEIIDNFHGEIKKVEDTLYLNIDNIKHSIDTLDNTVKCPNDEFALKENLLTNDNNIYYIGFSDLSNMLNLYTRWDKDNKVVNCRMNSNETLENNTFYNSDDNSNTTNTEIKDNNIKENKNSTISENKSQIALIRLEDICATGQNYAKDYFENLRIIGIYLNDKNIPYHIAWIPRYINPSLNIDNDPLSKNTFELAEMVYTLDYLNSHNGIIGLHGYTHQFGEFESGAGFEFGRYEPSTKVFREKIEKAIETAKYLDTPIDFFEAPHYEITPEQNKIAEEYFKILYYPFNDYGIDKADLSKPQVSPYNGSSLYISPPLDYIAEGMEEECLDRIKNSSIDNMGSVFFHPGLDKEFILLSEDEDGAPVYSYDDSSFLKRLVGILDGKGYRFAQVDELLDLTFN